VVADGVGLGGRVVAVGAGVVTVGRLAADVDGGVWAGVAEGDVATVVWPPTIGVRPVLGAPEEHAVVSAKAHPAAITTRRMPLT
jgi:hypothetical protein